MTLNFRQMSIADNASLVCVALLPIASLAGNSAADLALVLNVVVFLVTSRGDIKDYPRSWFLRLAFVFWGWILICSALSAFPSHSFQDSLPWIRFPLYAFALSHLLGKRDGSFLNYFIIFAMIGTLIEFTFMLREYIFFRGDNARLYGTFGKLIAGWYLDCFSLIAVLWSFEQLSNATMSIKKRLLLGTFVIITVYAIGITGEIMSTVFFLGVLLLYFVIRKSYSAKHLVILCVGGISLIVTGLAISFIDPVLQERLIRSATTRLPWMATSDYNLPWKSGLTMAMENPLFGVGPKNFNPYCLSLKNSGTLETLLKVSECQWHPHNLFIQIMAEAGIVGILLFAVLVAYVLIKAYRHSILVLWSNNTPLVLAVVLFFPIQSYSHGFGQSKNFYFWTTLGYILYRIRREFGQRGSDVSL
jgi:O-antigen ligase